MKSLTPGESLDRGPLPLPTLLTPNRLNHRRLYSPAGLKKFFAALQRLEEQQSAAPVRIVQIGDSHTANDAFSGRIREALQGRFGSAGRGWLPAGIPFKFYRPRLTTVTETGWRHLGVSGDAPAAAIGIDAVVARSEHPNAQMTLIVEEGEGFTRLAVEFLAQPHGGALLVQADQRAPVRIATAASSLRAVRRIIPVADRAHRVELRAIDRNPVHLIGWTAEHNRAGVIYENHGTIGATVHLLGRMSPATLAHELSDSCPALIVIAFGTNEGFDRGLDLRDYQQAFPDHVYAVERMAPQAGILVLGPPDGNQADAGSAACSGWHQPPNLAAIRRIQCETASDRGWAFWDWSQAMGGEGSMRRLVMGDPPLALPDHMHLNGFGYAATADVLIFDLLNAYETWKSAPKTL